MSDTIVIALISGAFAAIAATVTAFLTLRGKVRENRLVERRDTIADRDSLISTLTRDVATMRAELDVQRVDNEQFKTTQRAETALLRAEVQQVRDHNNALIAFIYRCLAIFRKHGLMEEVPYPLPDGVTVGPTT